MEIHDFLRSRRSIRRFTNKPVDQDAIIRILETACYAPSAHNRQPWRFAVLSTAEMKKRLAESMASAFSADLAAEGTTVDEITKRINRSKDRIQNASVVIVVCLDETALDKYPDMRRQTAEKIMGIQSVSMAGLQLLQAAQAEGLGAVWTCGPLFAPEVVRSSLSLSESWLPQGMLLIGHPAEKPSSKVIKPLADVVRNIE